MKQTKTASAGGTAAGGGHNGYYNNFNRSGSAAQPVYAVSGQVIGTTEGDTFTKRVRSSKHMLRKPPAWALDDAVLRDLSARGVVHVVYIDTETGRTYRTTVDTFASKGRLFNRGAGAQAFLTIGHWSIDGAPPALAVGVKGELPPGSGQQLALFGDGQP